MGKVRVIQKIVLDVLSLFLVISVMLITELKVRHIKKFILIGSSLFLVISAFLIQDMFSSLWKVPIAFVLLVSAHAVFKVALK
jgi:hypothetical protein